MPAQRTRGFDAMIQLLIPAPDAGRGREDGPATARPAVAGGAARREMFRGDSRGRRILVVDDFPDSASSLALALRWAGFQARAASDGQSALAIVEAWRPDVAILELALPGMDGFELARRLRGGPGGHELLLIAY